MCIKRNLFIVILIFFQISILSQVNMQHLEYVANDYYNNFIVKRNFKYCTVFQYTSDSTYKYNISDDNNPIPIIPPDTFILIHDSILVCYYYNFPPDISKNYQTLNKLKYFYKVHFNETLPDTNYLPEYDPPQSLYYFIDGDTTAFKVDYISHSPSMFYQLFRYYEEHSKQEKKP